MAVGIGTVLSFVNSAGACPLVGRYTIAGLVSGGRVSVSSGIRRGHRIFRGWRAAAGSSPAYPAAGERATTLRRDAYLEAAAPPTPAAQRPSLRPARHPGANMQWETQPGAPRSAPGNGRRKTASGRPQHRRRRWRGPAPVRRHRQPARPRPLHPGPPSRRSPRADPSAPSAAAAAPRPQPLRPRCGRGYGCGG